MIIVVFENDELVMIQDRFIENLVIQGSVENYRQIGTKKLGLNLLRVFYLNLSQIKKLLLMA